MRWVKKEQDEIKSYIFNALDNNKNYVKEKVLGIPASYLDSKVFSQDNTILKDAPFLSVMVNNPNHIGCHTLDASESFFSGTQAIEREVISFTANDILKGEGDFDGYIASGGTEANIQAIWIYRNYFIQRYNARHDQICILCSEDSHYSMDKAANLLNVRIYKAAVDANTRALSAVDVELTVETALDEGVKYFIVVANMMTTMFGSVDDYNVYTDTLIARNCHFQLHVDAAYGGFYYPFSNPDNELNFANEHVTSITLDAHKMAQAPYGTGIFLIRKGFMGYATTKEASYVKGDDSTLIGSRSGANAVAVWMILSKYGPHEWFEKIVVLQNRTSWLCKQLDELAIDYYRNPFSNIITIKSAFISPDVAQRYGLVPDNHSLPEWYKIVVMDHVSIEKVEPLIQELGELSLQV